MAVLDFYTSLKYTLFIQRIFCISPFKINQDYTASFSRCYLVYGILNIVSIFVTYFMGIDLIINENIFSINNPEISRQSRLSVVIGVLEMGLTYFVFISVILTMYFTRKHQVEFLDLLRSVDKIFQEDLGVSVNYNTWRFRRNAFIVFFISYHFCFEYLFQFMSYDYELGFHKFLIFFLYNCQSTVARFTNFTFFLYVNMVRKRFELLRKAVAKNADKYTTEDSLLLVTDLFKKLQKSHETINEIFGPVNLFTATHDFTLSASQLFMVIWIVSDMSLSQATIKVFSIVLWFLPNLIKIVAVSNIGDSMATEMKKCKRVLFRGGLKNEDTMDIVENFTLRLQHYDDNYSASNFFPINNSLLYTMAGAATTYLFVFIQFRTFEDNQTINHVTLSN
ncbi:hypothetical protein DMENIID0001_097050 [Sergentomyia squamirostris]